MIINEKGLTKALKHAYGNSGYTVMQDGEQITLYSDIWYVRCDLDKLPRKALATLVEHLGIIPGVGEALTIQKNDEVQNAIPEMVWDSIKYWVEEAAENMTVSAVPMRFRGAHILQQTGGGAAFGALPVSIDILEKEIHLKQIPARVTKNSGLSWAGEGEVVIVKAARGATAYWLKAWERDVWEALETVDLHKREE